MAALFGPLLWAVVVFAPNPGTAQETPDKRILIGVLAFRGVEHTIASWAPMARYLTARIYKTRFEIVPLPLTTLREATEKGIIDYVFTNPGQYVKLETAVGINRIVTLKQTISSRVSNVYGASIFVRAERKDIKELGDLRGKVFAAVSRNAFGGFEMAWREFKTAGINPFEDFKELRFMGFPQDDIVLAVRDGVVDAGTVRADVLDIMSDEKKIKLEDFRILKRPGLKVHKKSLSTRIYPEWPLAALPHVPAELSERVTVALLNLKPGSPEMLASGYTGWTVPLDYKPVHDLFKDLELGPYAGGKARLLEVLHRHWQWVVFISVISMMIILHGIRTEYLVQRRTRQLSQVNRELEHEIQERRSAEERVRQHETELAHVSRVSVIGEMTSGLAHELRQPLAAIRNYAEGGIRRLKRKNADASDLDEALNQIAEQAGRAGQIIARVRGYMRKRQPKRERIDMNKAVQEAVTLFSHDAHNLGIELKLTLAPALPPVMGDMIEIEQMIINLSRNAIDAMESNKEAEESSAEGGSHGRLEISTAVAEGDIVVRITDTGPGLTDEDLDKIWQPFMTTKDNGLGLGLAICRSIAEAHGGRIWAEPTQTSGLSVIFHIPIAEEASDNAA
ncbi:MAG: PhnD/SsuA/transferrin family substrate-binding protein [Proteobacteria bacterium]|nr:PhnD/SsuA/transferrin family substrate-binding protein [Pseudomonadota bacterium]